LRAANAIAPFGSAANWCVKSKPPLSPVWSTVGRSNRADGARERGLIKEKDSRDFQPGLEKSLGGELRGLTFNGYECRQADQLDKPLSLDPRLSVADDAHLAGSLLLSRPRRPGSDSREAPEAREMNKRECPIEIGHPGRWRDRFEITLPPGHGPGRRVDETPLIRWR
jgi:hypothetical protein